jgi:hypothetical protein
LKPPLDCDDWTSRSRVSNIEKFWRDPALPQPIRIDGTKEPQQPWPSEKLPRLLWLRRHDADLSIRTLPQLDQLARARRDALNPPQEQQSARQTLNQPPRDYFDRLATPLETAARPPVELDDLISEGATSE